MEDKSKKVRSAAYRGYADGSVDFFGNQIETITGYSRDVFLSRTVKWIDIVHKDDLSKVKEIFKEALKGDKTYMREYRILTRSGAVKWIQEWGQIVCDAEGKAEYVIGVVLDVTEQKQEEEIKRRIAVRSGRYLIFRVGHNEFGLSINHVKEIVGLSPVTPVPSCPECVPGVINLRGRIIPVLDIRRYYGITDEGRSETSSLVIAEHREKDATALMGITVDEVCEVLFIKGELIEEMVDLFSHSLPTGIWGVAKLEKRMILLIDVKIIFEDVFKRSGINSITEVQTM